MQDAAASSAPADTQQLGRELTSPPPADLGGVHLWDELGTPRQAHVACPGCRESDEVGSHFDSAWCCHCGWRGSLTAMREPLSVERVALLRALEQRACCLMWDDAPYVCPGCYAIGGESCAADCPDAAIERDREERIERDWDGEVDGD